MNGLICSILLAGLLCPPYYGWAQTTQNRVEERTGDSLMVGVLAGGALSAIKGDLTEAHRFRGDVIAGVYVDYQISQYVTSKFQLYYIGMGTAFSDNLLNSSLRFGYLVLPALIGVKVRDDINLFIGPYGGYLLRAIDHTDNFESDISDLIADFDFGFKVALEYHLNSKWSILLGYHHGLHDISDNQAPRTFNQYNRAFSLSLSYYLSIIPLNKPQNQHQP